MVGRIRRLNSPLVVALAGIALVALATMAFASTASAKSLYFVGEADDDGATTIHFKAKGHYEKAKKGKKFVAEEVSLVRVYNQQFVCYTANGTPTPLSGRDTYIGYSFIDPIGVEADGRFGGFHRTDFEYYRFRGKIKNKKATGAYQTQASEAGLEFGYCGDKNPVDWTAKAQRSAPEPPPDPEL